MAKAKTPVKAAKKATKAPTAMPKAGKKK